MKLTLRHLYELETYVINSDTHTQLQRVQVLIENFNKIFSPNEQEQLRHDLLVWLNKYNIRVSLLLRMGLQNQDGSFVLDASIPIAQDMLKNLGENIYAVTRNGKILERANNNGMYWSAPSRVRRQILCCEQMENRQDIRMSCRFSWMKCWATVR